MKTYILIILIALIGITGLYFAGTVLLRENLEVVDVLDSRPGLETEDPVLTALEGKPAPEFELPIVSGEKRPDLYVFQDRVLDGRPTVLVFWASWHQDSVDQLKILLETIAIPDVGATSGVAEPFEIIAVDLQEDKSRVVDFITRLGLVITRPSLVYLVDETGEVGELYNVRTLPTTYFIDGQGVIQDIFVGVLNKNMLEERINKLISK